MRSVTKARPTLGLAMIMKNEVSDLDRIIHDYGQYFNKIYVTVTDYKTHVALKKKFAQKNQSASKIEISYFKWVNHFGKARRYNQQQIKTDYWMWIDLDDEIVGAENIPSVLDYMTTNKLDVVWFQYDYIPRANLSEPQSMSWRERIIKTAPNLAWSDVAVHETLDESVQGHIKEELSSDIIIKHRKTNEQFETSRERNRTILEKDWQQSPNAVTGYYLGGMLRDAGDYEGAIEKLLFATEHSDLKPVRFGAWENICECYLRMGRHNEALAAADQCIAIDPDHPGPWYQKFNVFWDMNYHNTALYFAEIAMGKHIQGNLEIVSKDPSYYRYKGPFKIAQAYLSMGIVERAHQLYLKVCTIAPEYIEEQSTAETQWKSIFEQAYRERYENTK